jgi:peptidyl-prolyl cis-trans isomerase C
MPIIRHVLKLALAPALVLALAPAALAQEAKPEDNKVIAVVNGHEIKTLEVQMAADDIIGQLPDLPPKMRFPFVVNYLIERHLLAQEAVKESIADTEEYKQRLALYQAKALRDTLFFQKIRPMVSEEEIKKAYEEEAAKVQDTERVRARHILVATEKEAKDVLAKLKAGEKFEDIAKKMSLDGSKEFGGDLGYFTAPEMVADFSKAAFALKTGETSGPVKTDYGWHIIRVEDRKKGAAQPYEQVKNAIRNILTRKKVQEKVIELQKAAKIEIKDEDLRKFMAEQAKKREQAKNQPKKGELPADGSLDATDGKGDLALPQ